MRRKTDMWHELDEPIPAFLPEVGAQETQTAVADIRERLDKAESQLLSQYTSIAAYAQIAQQSVDTARAEARADLDRETNTLVSLIENARNEWQADSSRDDASVATAADSAADSASDSELVIRLLTLEDRFDHLNQLFTQCLRNQEELANSIASLLEHQMREPVGHVEPAEQVEPAGPVARAEMVALH